MLRTLPAVTSVEEICTATDRDGAVIIAEILEPAAVTAIDRELEPHLTALSPGSASGSGESAPGYGRRTRRLQSLIARSDAVVACMAHPLVLAWVERQLAVHTGGFQLSSAELIEIGPGEIGQSLHADGALLWPSVYRPDLPETMVTCMYALTDFTEANGATRVAPGSQRWDVRSLGPAGSVDTVVAEMRAGSALLFTGKVWHGGGPNVTVDLWRRGIAITYAAGWLRPEEALCLSVSLDRARQLPPRLQELIGYRSYVPRTDRGVGNMLWGFDKRDASEALVSGPVG